MSRVITALIFLPVLIASIRFKELELIFALLAAAAIVLGVYEFYQLARRREMQPDTVVGMTFAVGVIAVFYLVELDLLLAVLPAFVITTLIVAALRGAPFDKMLSSAGATILGVLYVALLGGFLISVRTGFAQPRAAQLLFFFFFVLMGSDIAAYYMGRTLGKHKLAPAISPGKTWEGAVGGMIASLLAAAIAHFWFFPELKLAAALPLAAAMNVRGVGGDLTESALKRGAGAKDAANILPGHGGLLDRLDSLLFNAPVIYYFGNLYFK
ncbi:MAG: phosphatidate cytidylyltransferase [Pyrinomonadaceae bacterium]|nr:phosphatidate cytidylyltransferase [Pyrinomonadaceae bacterium]